MKKKTVPTIHLLKSAKLEMKLHVACKSQFSLQYLALKEKQLLHRVSS
jgi:hypothetical protein